MTAEGSATERHSLAIRLLIRFFLLEIKRRYLYWVIAFAATVLAAMVTARFWTEVLWFRSVGYLDVLVTIITAKIWMGVFPALFVATLIAVNMRLAVRLSPLDRIISADEKTIDRWRRWATPFVRPIIITVAMVVGVIFGFAAYQHWDTYLLWANAPAWGRADPQFGYDLSYFVFDLPMLLFVNTMLFWSLLVAAVLTILTSYVFGGIRPQSPGAKLPPQVNAHFSILLGLLIVIIGWGLLLELHMLSYSERGVITGLGFTDANASLVAYQFVATGCVALFVLFQVNVRKPGWLLPTVALLWLFLLGLAIARGYPELYQLVIVEPQELEREAPYIEKHLEFTRYGFGLADVEAIESEGEANVTDLGDLGPTVGSLRLWDEDTLWITYEQLQAFRSYYRFADVDTDRYPIDGALRQVMVGAREVDPTSVPEQSRTWENQHLIYTHGNGLVASAVAGHTPAGLPTLVAQGVPPVGDPGLTADNPRLYFGDLPTPYSIIGTRTVELDHPVHGEGFAAHNYGGEAGVDIAPPLRRMLFAIRFWDLRILLSRLFTEESRVIWHREVRERVELVAPFLHVDRNPYPVAVDGRIKWIVDAYTTSDMMPYAKRVDLAQLTRIDQPKQRDRGGEAVPQEFVRQKAGLDGVANYIRNSVKAVVDGYDGTVRLYVVDLQDPVLRAWQRVFPQHFLPAEFASDELRAHFRYAEDLFRVQSVVWTDYHMRDAAAFYAKEASWRIPPDASFIKNRRERATDRDRLPDLRPYYLFTRLPGRDQEEFAIVQPFTPEHRDVLTGYLIGRSDPGVYGQLVHVSFPPNETVLGPAQAQARIDQDPLVSGWTTLRMQSGSRVSRGKLVIQPIGDSVLYLEPLFVQADKSEVSQLLRAQLASVPELKKVVAVWGDRVVMRDTLDEVLRALFGELPRVRVPGEPPLDLPGEPIAAAEPSPDLDLPR